MAKRVKPRATQAASPEFTDAWWTNKRLMSALLACLAMILYLNSLGHGFVLDDSMLITQNAFTTKGVAGMGRILTTDSFVGFYQESAEHIKVAGGRYRPLSLLVFATVYQVFGASPMPFHWLNVLLYGMLAWFLYRVLRHATGPILGGNAAAVFSAVATGLFVVHPVHTEVVDNIKSMDEILCLLLSAAALHLSVRFQEKGKRSLAVYAGIALFLALLAKETAVIFLGLIPLLLWIRKSPKAGAPALSPLFVGLAMSFLAYFAIRLAVLGWSMGQAPLELINNPFVKYQGTGWVPCTSQERLAMIFFSLWKYLVLLVFPLTLTSDYYPRMVEVITFANTQAMLGVLFYAALGITGVWLIRIRRWRLAGFGILLFLLGIGLVSNLFFPIGTNMAERFLFTPSLGFAMVVALPLTYGIQGSRPAFRYASLGAIVLIGLFFSWRTVSRNPDFKSNQVLFARDIQVSARSAKMQNAYGALVAEQALNSKDPAIARQLSEEALSHLNQALTIHPTYIEAFYMRGNVNFLLGRYESAVSDYRRCLELNPDFQDAYGNYALALREAARGLMASGGDTAQAIRMLEESLRLFPQEEATRQLLDQARANSSGN